MILNESNESELSIRHYAGAVSRMSSGRKAVYTRRAFSRRAFHDENKTTWCRRSVLETSKTKRYNRWVHKTISHDARSPEVTLGTVSLATTLVNHTGAEVVPCDDVDPAVAAWNAGRVAAGRVHLYVSPSTEKNNEFRSAYSGTVFFFFFMQFTYISALSKHRTRVSWPVKTRGFSGLASVYASEHSMLSTRFRHKHIGPTVPNTRIWIPSIATRIKITYLMKLVKNKDGHNTAPL